MKTIPFDQYQRYNNAALIINNARKNPEEKFRILEVGANEHQNLERFLPNDDIKYLDIQLPDELLNNPKYILGDATEMNFEDGAFDIIVALDVFEHIPPERRNKFIDELYRVCTQFCIITAPFHSEEVVETEVRVNNIFRSLFRQGYRWLEEHRENGLPLQDDLTQYLNSHGISHQIFNHGDLRIWEKIMGLHFIAAAIPQLAVYRQEVDDFYNNHLFESDYSEKSYRKIFIIWKNRKTEIVQRFSRISAADLKHLDNMELVFFQISNFLGFEGLKVALSNNPEKDCVDCLQVYFDFGNGFNEKDSYNIEVQSSLFSHFSLNLEQRDIKALRIDPSHYPGCFKIENLILIDAEDKYIENYTINGSYTFQVKDVLVFEHEDPNIVLEFLMEMKVKKVEFDVFYISKDYKLLLREFKATIIEQEQANLLLKNELNKSLETIKTFKAQLDQAQSELEVTSAALEQTRSELEVTSAALEQTQSELEVTSAALEQTQSELEVTSATLEQTQSELEVTRAKLEQRQAEAVECSLKVKAAQTQLDNIYRSRSWKLITGIRKILRK